MLNIALTSAAIIASSALASAQGTARVINKCEYPIHLCNTPSAGGGYSEITQTLDTNGQYTQQWTELSNGNGWSIKLSQTDNLNNILQYEYTYHDDGIIWYDLSEVNGNPWDGNWEITATGACHPKQQAYRYSTDDAYGMQACAEDTEITVTLCSGESQDDGPASSASASVYGSSAATESTSSPAETSSAAAPTSAAPAPSSTEAATSSEPAPAPSSPASSPASSPSWGQGPHTWGGKNVEAAAASTVVPSSSLTTFATVTTSSVADQGYDVTVTDVQTQVVTNFVTMTAVPAKRHEHHPRHPHHIHA